jgi:hypothetical protein
MVTCGVTDTVTGTAQATIDLPLQRGC